MSRRIINTSNEDYWFTYDGGNFGPLKPGQIAEYEDWVAHHAIKRAAILDPELGDPIGSKVQYLEDVDPATVLQLITFECPMAQLGQCKLRFKTMTELTKHMATHAKTDTRQPALVGEI